MHFNNNEMNPNRPSNMDFSRDMYSNRDPMVGDNLQGFMGSQPNNFAKSNYRQNENISAPPIDQNYSQNFYYNRPEMLGQNNQNYFSNTQVNPVLQNQMHVNETDFFSNRAQAVGGNMQQYHQNEANFVPENKMPSSNSQNDFYQKQTSFEVNRESLRENYLEQSQSNMFPDNRLQFNPQDRYHMDKKEENIVPSQGVNFYSNRLDVVGANVENYQPGNVIPNRMQMNLDRNEIEKADGNGANEINFYSNISNRSETIGGNIENSVGGISTYFTNRNPIEGLNQNEIQNDPNTFALQSDVNFYSNRSEAIGGNIEIYSNQQSLPNVRNHLDGQEKDETENSQRVVPDVNFFSNRFEAIGANEEKNSDIYQSTSRGSISGQEKAEKESIPSARVSPDINFYSNRSEAIGANVEYNDQLTQNERQISGQESDQINDNVNSDFYPNRSEAVGGNVDNLSNQQNLTTGMKQLSLQDTKKLRKSEENLLTSSRDFYSNRSETIGANVKSSADQANLSTSRKQVGQDRNELKDNGLPPPHRDFYSNRSETIGANVENLDDQQSISSSNRKKTSREERSDIGYREKNRKCNESRRHRRYEDESDYLSDEERHSTREKNYNRKYYSLKKDRERSKRSSKGYNEDMTKREVIPGKNKDDYESDQNLRDSRPSSRSDSMHESLNRRREKDYHRSRRNRDRYRPRETFNSYMQNYGYDPYAGYYQQYQYLEDLRRNNPQAYAEWYRTYYQQHAARQNASFYGGDDRESVHSGRSSENGNSKNSSFVKTSDQLDSSYHRSGRLTPAKFVTSHATTSIQLNNLVKIVPKYQTESLVEVINLTSLLGADDEFNELVNFPGPLVKGVTHKKTVVEYCEQKIRSAYANVEIFDPDSYILMWELLILLLRQNGMVVGSDIAELLLKNRKPTVSPNRPLSVISQTSSAAAEAAAQNSESSNPKSGESDISMSVAREEEITNKFREYLLYGSDKEALEWAMKHGLWGHALFLASKLDKRTYANVMMRFANGLSYNDPLQTLYQLLSGKLPAAVTCIADEKWGDWKPHLAMILSNSTQRPELNRKAISSLGDTLLNKGNLYAAQFCYLMADVEFGKYGDETSKLVLLGSDVTKPFNYFTNNEAIHMTEVYEYACSLNNPDFVLPEFQVYKYFLAIKLADKGLLEKSMGYLEKISYYIVDNLSKVSLNFVSNVYKLSDRFKYFDFNIEEYDGDEANQILNNQPEWLRKLEKVYNEFSTRGFVGNNENSVNQNYETHQSMLNQEMWQPQLYDQQENSIPTGQQWQQVSSNENYNQIEQVIESPMTYNEQQEQQQFWYNKQEYSEQAQIDDDSPNYLTESLNDVPQPQISMPNHSKSAFVDEPLPHEKNSPMKKPHQPETAPKSSSTGWFGGIFSKLPFKPKNQMILPDDKNPSIVWDEQKKRWINVDEDNNESVNEVKPPPKMAEIRPQIPAYPNIVPSPQVNQVMDNPIQNAPPVAQNNMFKLQKSRNLKKSYVDIFNPGDGSKSPASVPGNNFYNPAGASQQPAFFIPQPVNNPNTPTSFLTNAEGSITAPPERK